MGHAGLLGMTNIIPKRRRLKVRALYILFADEGDEVAPGLVHLEALVGFPNARDQRIRLVAAPSQVLHGVA